MKEAEEIYGLSIEGAENGVQLFTACVGGVIVQVGLEFTPCDVGAAYTATITDTAGTLEFRGGTVQNQSYCEEKAESIILHALTTYEGLAHESGKTAALNK